MIIGCFLLLCHFCLFSSNGWATLDDNAVLLELCEECACFGLLVRLWLKSEEGADEPLVVLDERVKFEEW